ncbi:Biofilm growth-associated repressor [invertebrate metagenome]|uniref:Biofilm growth-associated repressor n=1 Tax=invertebrate metagenome TaxID=1711999 RepID=A0A2H9TAD4_9ZZZZ
MNVMELLAHLGKSMGDPLRLQILRVLSTESLGVLELSAVFSVRQPAMSHHLKVLLSAGLVVTRKEGNTVFYRRALPVAGSATETVTQALFAVLDKTPITANTEKQLNNIRLQRAERSRQFFIRYAEAFRQHQELIAEHSLYADCLIDMIKKTDFPENDQAMEVGPGNGLFLTSLRNFFRNVCAVDNSEVMLERSRQHIEQQKLTNITLFLGEIGDITDNEPRFDCIVANMVLHHVSVPSSIFKYARRLLKPGGSLLISELTQHDQDWVKTSCGDVWQGFSTEELDLWASRERLEKGQSQYLGLRNGFQVQVRRFYRAV